MSIKIGMISLGCSKNLVDSEVMLGMLKDNGYEIVNDINKADAVIVNTCGFIESAKAESIETIFETAQLKTTGRLKKLFVTGCLVQRYSKELIEEIPEIDGFMGVRDYKRLPEFLNEAFGGRRPVCVANGERFINQKRVLTTSKFSAYVKISDGCDNRCTYCAIPLIRGAYASRPYEDIISECRSLAAEGVTEITFIAQDTSRYGTDFEGAPLMLKKLLRETSEIEGIHWIRVLYCYPDTVTEELLAEIRDNPKVCAYLDLPLQHFDDEVLKRMNRRGDSGTIRKLIAMCREYGIVTRTTMMVGFPGETQQQFENMLNFVKEAKFDRLGAFSYSPEEGTAAAEWEDQIDEDVKRARLDELMMAQQAISLENNTARVGTVCEALIERFEDGEYLGRSYAESPEEVDGIIHLKSGRALKPGEYVQVRITDCDAYDLMGEVL